MSIVSSRVSSVASILKTPGSRSSLLDQPKRIRFKLPDDLRNVLLNFETGADCQMYKDLVCILRDSNLKDNELLSLLSDVQQCITLLNERHRLLIEALLNISWTDRSPEVTTAYKRFVEELLVAHVYHSKFVMDKLIQKFKPVNSSDPEWENGKPRAEDLQRLNHVHDILQRFLHVIPMCQDVLMQSLTSAYPHMSLGTHSHELYVYALLQITEYAPKIRRAILHLIVHRLVELDANASPSDIHSYEEDEDEAMEEDGAIFNLEVSQDEKLATNEGKRETKHPIARTLDVCMEQMFIFIYNSCHVNEKLEIDLLKTIYNDLLNIFEELILPTCGHHVQYLLFYLCSFRTAVVEAFVKFLWQKVSNPNMPHFLRQQAVAYVVGLLARATFIPLNLLQGILGEMANWIHSYIYSQDSLECVNNDIRVHIVFYSICQGLFYLLAFRHKEIMNGRKNLLFLQGLNLNKIVSCRLNPLRVCQTAVVQNFAAVTRKYQLAYCYTVIEHNSRSNLPVYNMGNIMTITLEPFFPFDPYLLARSEQRIIHLYYNSQCMTLNVESKKANQYEDDDDFIDESFSSDTTNSHSYLEKFSYGTSPGFVHT